MRIVININGKTGRPLGASDKEVAVRNGYIIKAYRNGFRRKVIAKMMGISYGTVCKALK